MSFYRHSHTKKECTLQVCTPLSSWSVSIPGELLSSRAHLRFDKDNANISTIFCIFNLSNLREAYSFILGGGSRAFSASPRLPGAGPAGLRWLLKSPPRLAGQAPPTLRASRFNPCRGRGRFERCFAKLSPLFQTCLGFTVVLVSLNSHRFF